MLFLNTLLRVLRIYPCFSSYASASLDVSLVGCLISPNPETTKHSFPYENHKGKEVKKVNEQNLLSSFKRPYYMTSLKTLVLYFIPHE